MKNKRRHLRRSPIHKRIAEFRRARGLTQSDLARLLKVDETAVSHWETALNAPSNRRLPAIAQALGVSIGELFGEAA